MRRSGVMIVTLLAGGVILGPPLVVVGVVAGGGAIIAAASCEVPAIRALMSDDSASSSGVSAANPSSIPTASSTTTLAAQASSETTTLPQETIEYLEGRNVKELAKQNMERYLAAEKAEGVPWQVMAALHYREAGMNPESSISNGAPLGSGTNVDGVDVVADANQDAINMAAHFKRMALYIYDIDVKSDSMTTEKWGQAFLAYNRGALYKMAGRTYDQSPYVMNGYDASHLNMHWIDADTVSGVDGNKAGALTVMTYLGGSLGGATDSCGNSIVAGNLVSPVTAERLYVTSGFDFRVRDNGIRRNHNGVDLIGGSEVVAAMGGTVIIAGSYGGYGNAVKIDHGDGVFTLYGHMEWGSLRVSKGQVVTAGQPLGTMGNTGDSEGTHLHFEYWENDVPVNPFPVLKQSGIDLTWTPDAYPRNEKPGPQD